MNMMREILIFLVMVCLTPALAFGRPIQAVVINADVESPAYPRIEFVTVGKAYGFSDEEVRGKFLRVVLVSPELAYDAPILRVETLTYGDEGCCTTVVNATELNLGDLTDWSAAKDQNGFRFGKWLSPSSFTFSLGAHRYVLRNANQKNLRIEAAK
ncbi:hypothetical protein [Janthinobacterium sp. 17J80-10]|uniref:hypothetical protein n=1 Tax=Janthinobacterium sp. 17J80-10 TaxID=2497863 RepID=UPI001005A746|nr:hypothetical protein [Janthinobacterium sp. 17J80-10]QAU34674.1 hypothetical protein EKL02_11030 [Janthinobacterium sp. 17J80-10]